MRNRDSNLLQLLVKFGLTKQEANIYFVLWQKGSLTAQKVAEIIGSLPHAVYRAAKKLEENRLISIIKTKPITFQAISPTFALSAFVKEKVTSLQLLADEATNCMVQEAPSKNPTVMNLIMGQDATYMYGAKLLDKTKSEMLVISLGEAIPQGLLLSVKKAHERGVMIRMIAQKYDAENKEILENFEKNGYEIRHFPSKGFHLAIYDGQQSLLIVSNPQKPQERAAVHIASYELSKFLRDYYYTIWKKALPIE